MDTDIIRCPECGTENSPENDFCSTCGGDLPRSKEDDAELADEQQ
jgi:rRNA maturation endonuclease Nob1